MIKVINSNLIHFKYYDYFRHFITPTDALTSGRSILFCDCLMLSHSLLFLWLLFVLFNMYVHMILGLVRTIIRQK